MSSAPQIPGVERRGAWTSSRWARTTTPVSFDQVALADEVLELLSVPAYERIAQP